MSAPLPPYPLPLGYPDAEKVVKDILRPLGAVGTWLPENWDATDDALFQHVQRIGGGPDESDITEYPLMRVSWYATTRDRAMDAATLGERWLLAHKGRKVTVGASTGILVDHVSIDVGPSVDPDLDPDDRRVTKNLTIGMRRQYHLVAA